MRHFIWICAISSACCASSILVLLARPNLTHCSFGLYALFFFYKLTKEELAGRRPLAKFMAIKLVVAAMILQAILIQFLVGKVIRIGELGIPYRASSHSQSPYYFASGFRECCPMPSRATMLMMNCRRDLFCSIELLVT